MKLSRPLAVALAFVALAVPALASAQGKTAEKAAAPVDDGRSYEYKFDDDLMSGGGIDGTSPIIHVTSHALRSQLIRPRTSFVPELLKSGESF